MAGAPVGALRVTLGANTAQFEQGMRRAQATARRTGQDIERSYLRMTQSGVRAFSTLRAGVASVAAVMAGNALIGYARQSLQWAAGLSETAQQIGVTVEQLQALRMAAEQNGASVEGMERAMAILNRTLGQAQAGLPQAVRAFQQLGISREQLQSFRSGGEALQAVITKLSDLRNPAQQAAAAQALFGRGARELMVMLTQGAGAMARWTEQARAAGIITDEQARKADDAEDALSRLATTIRAELAGALSDALPGIIAIIEALGQLARAAIWAIGKLGELGSFFFRPRSISVIGSANQLLNDTRGRGQAPNWMAGLAAGARPAPGGNRNLDMSPSSGGGGSRTNEAARRAHQFDQDQRRLQIDALRAQADSVEALDRRNEIQSQIAALENDQWLADLRFSQSQGDINEAQANRLIALKNALIFEEANARAIEYNQRLAEQENERAEQQEGYARDRAQFEADMAQTMEERRRLELDMLRITIENRRRMLEQQIAQAVARNDTNAAAKAQLELDNLSNVRSRETRRIMRDTMGPLEAYMTQLPRTAEQVREALQSVAVDGLQSISDGLIDVITGARKMGDVFKNVVTSIISDLLRIQLQRSVIGPLTSALSGLFGGAGGLGDLGGGGVKMSAWGGARAAGGPVLPGRMYLVGENGPELLRMGGSGGTVIANDQIGPGGDIIVHQSFKFDGVAITKDEFVQGLLATKSATMAAVRDARRRSS